MMCPEFTPKISRNCYPFAYGHLLGLAKAEYLVVIAEWVLFVVFDCVYSIAFLLSNRVLLVVNDNPKTRSALPLEPVRM